jgi:hypothetical protein
MTDNLIHLLPLHLRAEINKDPYFMTGEFFSYISLDECRRWLNDWFKAAFDEEFILKELPSDFLYSVGHLQLLLYACYLLTDEQLVIPKPKQEETTLSIPALRKRRDVVIKYLDIQEMLQPLNVIKAFFNFKNFEEWQLTIQLWKEAALGRTTVTETEDPGALPVIMEHLCKIAEAAWVIWASG